MGRGWEGTKSLSNTAEASGRMKAETASESGVRRAPPSWWRAGDRCHPGGGRVTDAVSYPHREQGTP